MPRTKTVESPETVAISMHWNQSELKERGWTPAMIKRLLGEPDKTEEWYYPGRGRGVRHLYAFGRVQATENSPEFAAWVAKRKKPDAKTISLLDAIREISHAAHRQRDVAETYYKRKMHGFAGNARRRKEYLYGLKEKGIVAAHKAGVLRYIGASPQGMGVYEYDEGGKSCFHSRLHPVGVERSAVTDHPETLFVEAKEREHAVKDAEHTLAALPDLIDGEYETVDAPRKPREERPGVICYQCGGAGHIAANCPQSDDDDFDDDDDF